MEAVNTPIDATALREKLAVLGNESYSAEICERYAGMIAEIQRAKERAAGGDSGA